MRLRALAESPHAFTSTYERESTFDEAMWRQRATTCLWFVAVDGGRSVGVAGGMHGPPGDPATRELIGMWVTPTHRGRGLARRLLNAVREWAAADGADVLSLGVRQGNPGARSAYLAMGLHPTGRIEPERDRPGRSIEFLSLPLRSDRSVGDSGHHGEAGRRR